MNDDIRKVILRESDKDLDEIADFILTKASEYLTDNTFGDPISDEGMLLGSGYVDKKYLEKTVGFTAPHGPYIELGTDPHKMPLMTININGKSVQVPVIYDWVRRKIGADDKKAISISWAIWNKIAKEGTDPKPFFRRAISDAEKRYS